MEMMLFASFSIGFTFRPLLLLLWNIRKLKFATWNYVAPLRSMIIHCLAGSEQRVENLSKKMRICPEKQWNFLRIRTQSSKFLIFFQIFLSSYLNSMLPFPHRYAISDARNWSNIQLHLNLPISKLCSRESRSQFSLSIFLSIFLRLNNYHTMVELRYAWLIIVVHII